MKHKHSSGSSSPDRLTEADAGEERTGED